MAALSAEGVRRVCQLQREEGRQCLRALLRWEEFDEVRDQRRSIELGSVYTSLLGAVQRSFQSNIVFRVTKFPQRETLFHFFAGLPVSQAIGVLRDKLEACEPTLSSCQACVLWEYFHNTLLRHYQLYQFVLCREREAKQTSVHLEICVPPQPLPLMAGVNAEVWQYQQQLAALSAAEAQKRTNMLLLRETLHLEREHVLQRTYDDLKSQAEILDRQVLEALVKEAIGTQMQVLRDILQTEIQTTFEILELRLQKKALLLSQPVPYPPPPLPVERAWKSSKAQQPKKKK
uniref:Chromosome 8 open reading frame 74 n=1 Tax=Pelodiscus sinensis TaxID=13735 RepID=K7FEL2_PELSI